MVVATGVVVVTMIAWQTPFAAALHTQPGAQVPCWPGPPPQGPPGQALSRHEPSRDALQMQPASHDPRWPGPPVQVPPGQVRAGTARHVPLADALHWHPSAQVPGRFGPPLHAPPGQVPGGRVVVVVGGRVVVVFGGGVVVVAGVFGQPLGDPTWKLKVNSAWMRFRCFLPILPW